MLALLEDVSTSRPGAPDSIFPGLGELKLEIQAERGAENPSPDNIFASNVGSGFTQRLKKLTVVCSGWFRLDNLKTSSLHGISPGVIYMDISPYHFRSLQTIQLSGVMVNPQNLLISLQRCAGTLKEIKLDRVWFVGSQPFHVLETAIVNLFHLLSTSCPGLISFMSSQVGLIEPGLDWWQGYERVRRVQRLESHSLWCRFGSRLWAHQHALRDVLHYVNRNRLNEGMPPQFGRCEPVVDQFHWVLGITPMADYARDSTADWEAVLYQPLAAHLWFLTRADEGINDVCHYWDESSKYTWAVTMDVRRLLVAKIRVACRSLVDETPVIV